MKNLLLLLALLGHLAYAYSQETEWLVQEHDQGLEDFRQMAYVNSQDEPFLINYLRHIIPGSIEEGPVTEHFIYAYDTAGTFLWRYETDQSPIAILTKEDDRFWIVTNGPNSLQVRNGILQSNSNTAGNLYFVEMDNQGQVLSHFIWEFGSNISQFIEDVEFDTNGDFLLLGRWLTTQFQDDTLSFANTVISLDGLETTHFIGRISATGTEMSVQTTQSSRNGNPVVLTRFAQNTLNGNILIAGRARDILHIGNDVLLNNSELPDLILLEFDANLNFLNGRHYITSNFGTVSQALRFNSQNGHFYLSGTCGNQLLLLDENQPVQGHQNFIGNSYIAEFDGTNLVQGTYLIPQTNSDFFRSITVFDIFFDNNDNLKVIANLLDESFSCGDSLITLESDVTNDSDIETVLLELNSEDMTFMNCRATSGAGDEFLMAAQYDQESGSTYLAGHFVGSFEIDSLSVESQEGERDGFLVKLKDDEGINLGTDNTDDQNFEIKVYPNPVYNDFVTIVSSETIEEIALVDQVNQVLFHAYPNSTEFRLHLGAFLNSGMYFLRINQNTTRKLLIKP